MFFELDTRWEGKPGVVVDFSKAQDLDEGEVPQDEILERVLFDQENNVYWVSSPEIDSAEKRFSVLKVSDGKVIYPVKNKNLKLRSYQEEVQGGWSWWQERLRGGDIMRMPQVFRMKRKRSEEG